MHNDDVALTTTALLIVVALLCWIVGYLYLEGRRSAKRDLRKARVVARRRIRRIT